MVAHLGVLAGVAVLEVAGTSVCAGWPLRHQLRGVASWADVPGLYSGLARSNLDVWAQSVAHSALIPLATAAACWAGHHRPAPRAYGRTVVAVTAALCQAALLGKCVLVALLGRDDVLPVGHPRADATAGLLFIFASVAISGAGLSLQSWIAQKRLAAGDGMGGGSQRLSDAERPLLEKGTGEPAGEAEQEQHTDAHTVSTLLSYSAADTPLLLCAFAAGTAAALAQALIPFLTGQIIDFASIDPDRHAFVLTTGKLVAVAAACAVATGLRGGLFTVAMTRLNVRIRQHLFASLLQQEIGFFDASKTGEITSRLAADTTTVSDQICLNINVVVRSLTQAAMVLVFMVAASWRLTVITVIMLPATIVIARVYGSYFRKLAKQVQAELAEANSVAEEVLGSMATVRAHAAEASADAAYRQRLAKFYAQMLREALAYALYMATNTFLPNLVNATVLFYGGSLVLVGRMSAGALVSFMLYQQSLASALQSMGDVFSSLIAAVGAADKVVELIKRQPRVLPLAHLRAPSFEGRLALEGVTFAYPARPASVVLRDLSFSVSPGQVVALVGPSGGGKSSVVKLIQRFYLPAAGRVLLDGRDVGLYDPGWLKRRVALVSQEPTLYARSVRRNICYGLEPEDGLAPGECPTDAEVQEAARLANAHDFIMAMPHGYDSDVGDRGVQLSGGQKQRLAIARALVRRPTVLLLDEATSALDAASEAAVQEALDRLMKQHTTLVIAHRLSTIQSADRILVILKGRVAEDGTHEELLDAGGIYSALVRRQLAKSASAASLRPSQSHTTLPSQPHAP